MPPTSEIAAIRPPSGRGVLANVLWAFSGNVVYSAAQFGTLIIVARLGDEVMLGQYALGLSIAAPLILVAGLALRTVFVTDQGPRCTLREYLLLRLVGMGCALGLVGVCASTLHWPTSVVVLLVGAAKALDGVADIAFGAFQRRGLMRQVAISGMLNGTLTAIFMAVPLASGRGVVWAILGSVVASAFSLGYCLHAASRLEPEPRPAGREPALPSLPARLSRLAWSAAPLGLASGVTSLTANIPKYVVGHSEGSAALGVFTAVGYVSIAGTVTAAAVTQAMLPRMTRLHALGRLRELRGLVGRLIAGAGLCVIGALLACVVLGGDLLRVVYGEGYRSYGGMLAVLLLAAGVGAACFFLDAALSATRRFGGQLVANASVLAVTLLAATVLTRLFGMSGAAWSVVVSMVFQCLVKAELFRRAVGRVLH